jgi:hypothetical protein
MHSNKVRCVTRTFRCGSSCRCSAGTAEIFSVVAQKRQRRPVRRLRGRLSSQVQHGIVFLPRPVGAVAQLECASCSCSKAQNERIDNKMISITN